MPGRLQEPIFRKFPFANVKQFTFRQLFERPPVFLVVFGAERLGFGVPPERRSAPKSKRRQDRHICDPDHRTSAARVVGLLHGDGEPDDQG